MHWSVCSSTSSLLSMCNTSSSLDELTIGCLAFLYAAPQAAEEMSGKHKPSFVFVDAA
jgi:hypothetical protein